MGSRGRARGAGRGSHPVIQSSSQPVSQPVSQPAEAVSQAVSQARKAIFRHIMRRSFCEIQSFAAKHCASCAKKQHIGGYAKMCRKCPIIIDYNPGSPKCRNPRKFGIARLTACAMLVYPLIVARATAHDKPAGWTSSRGSGGYHED